ncbi:MAG: MFS transporter [Oscillospiraceae bacterium]|nr:MFS transporter [Oscillospiraceae bacterium]
MENKKKTVMYAGMALFCMCLMQFVFTGILYSPLSLYTASIIEDLNITRTAYAVTLTAMSLVCMPANWILGWLKKKISIRGVLILGGSVMTVSMFLYSKANSLGMLYVAAILTGIAFAYVASAIGATVINTWFHKNAGVLVGASLICSGIGGTIFSPIVGQWIAGYGWRHSFTIASIIALVTTVIIGLLIRSEPASVGVKPMFYEEKENDEGSTTAVAEGLTLKEALRTPAFYATAVVWFVGAIIIYSIMSIIGIYVQDLGFDAAAAGKALAPLSLVNMLMPILLGWLADRIPVKYVVSGGLIFFAVSCIILLSSPSQLSMVYAIAVFTGIGVATLRSTIPMQIRRAFGTKEYATFAGLFVGIFSAGIACGAPIIARFFDSTGTYASAMKVYLPVLVVIILVMLLFSDKTGKKEK